MARPLTPTLTGVLHYSLLTISAHFQTLSVLFLLPLGLLATLPDSPLHSLTQALNHFCRNVLSHTPIVSLLLHIAASTLLYALALGSISFSVIQAHFPDRHVTLSPSLLNALCSSPQVLFALLVSGTFRLLPYLLVFPFFGLALRPIFWARSSRYPSP